MPPEPDSAAVTPAREQISRGLGWAAGLSLGVIVFAALFAGKLPSYLPGDFLNWWTAATLLSRGQDPYDTRLEAEFQTDLVGWDDARDGYGAGCLPFFHAPWLGLMCVPLLPLGYQTARAVWLALNLEMLILGGWLLRPGLRRIPPVTAVLLQLVFGFSLHAALLGQSSTLMFLCLVVGWRLLDAGYDRLAGAVLAVGAVKPHLYLVVMIGLTAWAVSRRRPNLFIGFVGGLTVLGLAAAVLPDWPLRMIAAIRTTPVPTDLHPGIGSSWLSVLRVNGARHGGVSVWALGLGYLAGAAPAVLAAWYVGWKRSSRPLDVIAVGVIGAFFVTPYCQEYDFVLLTIPVLVAADFWGEHILAVFAVLFTYAVGPYATLISPLHQTPDDKWVYFWVPGTLGLLWLLPSSGREPREATR